MESLLGPQELQKGDYLISPIESIIRVVIVHITIFFNNYFKYPWCLDVLLFMFGCRSRNQPLFSYFMMSIL